MLDLKLITTNEPILSQEAEYVGATDRDKDELEVLLDFMWVTLANAPTGIGLAANQVNCLKRVFIMDCQGIKQAFINPIITKASKKLVNFEEECLSCPGMRVKVWRHKMITVVGQDENHKSIKRKFRGVNAVIVQHEVDHLRGITLRTRLENETGQDTRAHT